MGNNFITLDSCYINYKELLKKLPIDKEEEIFFNFIEYLFNQCKIYGETVYPQKFNPDTESDGILFDKLAKYYSRYIVKYSPNVDVGEYITLYDSENGDVIGSYNIISSLLEWGYFTTVNKILALTESNENTNMEQILFVILQNEISREYFNSIHTRVCASLGDDSIITDNAELYHPAIQHYISNL